jgi:hypothetical protein
MRYNYEWMQLWDTTMNEIWLWIKIIIWSWDAHLIYGIKMGSAQTTFSHLLVWGPCVLTHLIYGIKMESAQTTFSHLLVWGPCVLTHLIYGIKWGVLKLRSRTYWCEDLVSEHIWFMALRWRVLKLRSHTYWCEDLVSEHI